MKDLLAKHPDLKDFLNMFPYVHSYTIFNDDDTIKEMWVKDDDGHWRDVTAREKAREEVERAKKELKKLKEKADV